MYQLSESDCGINRSAYMDVNLTFDTFAAKVKWENIFCLK